MRPVHAREVEVGTEIQPLSKLVTLEVSQAYSGWPERWSIHTDEGVARRLGFPAPVMQGILGPAYLSEMCFSFFGPDWVHGGAIDVKFTRPVFIPQRLTMKGVVREKLPHGERVILHLDVWVENEKGETVQSGTASALLPQ